MTFVLNLYTLLLGSLSLVLATPQLSFPVNAQIPPLAVVAQHFSFTFSPSTFSYDTPTISYSISNNAPTWLSFDASTRTFSGTPQSGDVGNFSFTLNANDTTGTATGEVTFVVVQEDGVTVGRDVQSQLEGFGGVDGNGGIVLSNEKGFTWQFVQDTFKTSGNPVQTYYAVSIGHTPLPSWIKFSADTLTFTGAAPEVFSQIAPPQYFKVTLIASTHQGFASASQSFNIVIGAHDLIIDPPTNYVNTTIGANVSYTFPLSSIHLDGRVIDRTNVSFITADLGDNGGWLKFDNSSLVLSGRPANGDKGMTVVLTIQDVFYDIVHSTIHVDLYDGLFATNLPTTLNATIGQKFSFVLNDTLFAASDIQVSVSFIPKGGDNWLSYDSDSRTILGTPEDNKAKSVQVDINASSASLSQNQTSSFIVQTVSSSGASLAPASPFSSSSNKSLIIGLSVSLPIIGIATLAGCVFYFRRRRESSKPPIRAGSPIPPISRPYIATPDSDWPLEAEKAWGEPSPLGGADLFKRGVSGTFTLKTSQVGTTGANVGRYEPSTENENALPTPVIGGPREPPKATRGSWRRGDGRDWASVARSSDASLATVSANEISSVRLVQSPNPNVRGSNSISHSVGEVSPLIGDMGVRGAAPVANVHPPPEENRANSERSQDTIGTFSDESSSVDYEEQWESADRKSPQRRGSVPGQLNSSSNANRHSMFYGDSLQSHDQHGGYDENKRKTRHQKRVSHRDIIDDAIEYRVSRVSGPLRPMSQNVDWTSSSGHNMPGRPRLVEFAREGRRESGSSSRYGSGEVTFG